MCEFILTIGLKLENTKLSALARFRLISQVYFQKQNGICMSYIFSYSLFSHSSLWKTKHLDSGTLLKNKMLRKN